MDRAYEADKETSVVCSSCHSIGRVMSERRTKQEWELLLAMHRGYYPGVDSQPMNDGSGFRRGARRCALKGAEAVRAETGQPDGPHHHAPLRAVSAAHRGMDRMGGGDAAPDAGGPLGDLRIGTRAREPIVGQVVITADPSVPPIRSPPIPASRSFARASR